MADGEVLELLQKIDARLDKLEQKQNEALNAMAIFGDSIDELFRPDCLTGKHNIEKVEQLKSIIESLTHNETLDSLKILIDNLHHLSGVVPKLSELENGVSMATDAIDEFMGHAMSRGVDLEKLLEQIKELSFLLVDAFESGALTKLMQSGVLESRSIETVGALGRSMAVSGHHTKPVSAGQVFGAIFDPNIRSALGFFINFASQFGKTLSKRKDYV